MKKLDSPNQKSQKKEMDFHGLLLGLLISVILLGILGISYIRSYSEAIFPAQSPQISKDDALKWYNAVLNGREKEALLYAAKIIPDDSPILPNHDFILLLSNNGLGTLLLTSPFNHFDYLRWKDSFEIQKILNSYTENKEPIMEIFKEVLTRKKPLPDKEELSLREMFHIKLANFKEKPYASSIDIWNKGYASFDELLRLFSAIAYQEGYGVQIVSFYDESWKLEHIVCELRKKDVSYVADFVYGKIWKDTTVSELELNPEGVKKIWPENVLKSINRKVYRLPAEAMDFKLYNMQLSAKLSEFDMPEMPLFGENPQYRIDEYIEKYSNKSEKSHYSYWNFPFQSLMSSPNFPKNWRLPPQRGE